MTITTQPAKVQARQAGTGGRRALPPHDVRKTSMPPAGAPDANVYVAALPPDWPDKRSDHRRPPPSFFKSPPDGNFPAPAATHPADHLFHCFGNLLRGQSLHARMIVPRAKAAVARRALDRAAQHAHRVAARLPLAGRVRAAEQHDPRRPDRGGQVGRARVGADEQVGLFQHGGQLDQAQSTGPIGHARPRLSPEDRPGDGAVVGVADQHNLGPEPQDDPAHKLPPMLNGPLLGWCAGPHVQHNPRAV